MSESSPHFSPRDFVPRSEALRIARNLEAVLGEVAAGSRQVNDLPLGDVAKLISFSRQKAEQRLDVRAENPWMAFISARSRMIYQLKRDGHDDRLIADTLNLDGAEHVRSLCEGVFRRRGDGHKAA